ncbi:sepiapterin reductase-like [Macrosteles quadrilineatus]|uniref:sepiapterin reductase-like n=1 Tax=Macrosteles quadrilineatus TaxID=74068 RepID=UPI0023E2EB40|nr:sepiapterin reductase-like [Macrosteles quadrilineatus]XP_054286783.1 sepiapterin reductase-like [Macrosteles quadrilineatus]
MPAQFWGQKTFCLLTGASQGIGRCFAVEFARNFGAGSHLVLLARTTSGLEQTRSLIKSANPQVTVHIHSVDLGDPDVELYKTILNSDAWAGESFDLKLLVHNAGSVGKANTLSKDMDDHLEWNRYLSLNLYHVTSLTAEFLRSFPSGHRCIVNVTSLCAVKPFKSMGYYCVGKAAREMYFKVLADENPDLDIINYSPGPVDTDMVSQLINEVQDEETKSSFITMKSTKTLVTVEQTTQKVIALLTSRGYKSGDRFDYYDQLPQ